MVMFERKSKDRMKKVQLCWERRWVLKYYEDDICHESIIFATQDDAFDTFEKYDIGETY